MAESGGYRGYITSRPVRDTAFPQRVQNLVVRDYAQRRGLAFRLSLTEYAMPGCSMMLETALCELDRLDGIILFSAFTLPLSRARRRHVFERVLASGKTLHAALENLVVRTAADVARWNDLIEIDALLPLTPFGGRYEKNAAPLGEGGTALAAAMGVLEGR
jgi:sporadic carbohydrate cluster protein (TIGR04323 family)